MLSKLNFCKHLIQILHRVYFQSSDTGFSHFVAPVQEIVPRKAQKICH